jgi:hypothetical protein
MPVSSVLVLMINEEVVGYDKPERASIGRREFERSRRERERRSTVSVRTKHIGSGIAVLQVVSGGRWGL